MKSEIQVKRINYNDFESDIKKNWLRPYIDWVNTSLVSWLENRSEDEKYSELLDRDWDKVGDEFFEYDIQKLSRDNEIIIIGLIDRDMLVGGIYIDFIDPSIAKINRLFVSEKYRRNGFGRKLVTVALQSASEKSVNKVRLSTGPFMQSAQELYKSLGFQYREKYPSSDVPDELVDYWSFMEKTL